MKLKEVIEYFHNYGMITYFNPLFWGENKIIILQPYFLVQVLRKVLNHTETNGGFLEISSCYSDIIIDDPNLVLSPMWIFSFITFLQKTELIFDLNITDPLRFQFKKFAQSKKIFVSLTRLAPSSYDWDTVNDLWDTFSYKKSHSRLITEQFKKDDLSSKIFYERKNDFVEKWYNIETHSLNFLNKTFLQVLRMNGADVIRIWSNMAIWTLESCTFVLGFFPSEESKTLFCQFFFIFFFFNFFLFFDFFSIFF